MILEIITTILVIHALIFTMIVAELIGRIDDEKEARFRYMKYHDQLRDIDNKRTFRINKRVIKLELERTKQ